MNQGHVGTTSTSRKTSTTDSDSVTTLMMRSYAIQVEYIINFPMMIRYRIFLAEKK